MTAYHDAVRQIEEHLMNSWPSLRTVMLDGWVFREAMGYTKRANSAMALNARGPFAATLGEAERFYAAAGSPTIFRLTPLAGNEPDHILADRGYDVVDETIVMTTALADLPPADEAVTIAQDFSDVWEDGYADAHALTPDARRAHRAILERIAPFSKGFAVAWEDGKPIAFGLGVVERGHLGLFDIVTVPEARRKGVARKLVSSLMRWGADRHVTTAWLSVIADNERAKPLYAQLGFREIYRYHYRISTQQAA